MVSAFEAAHGIRCNQGEHHAEWQLGPWFEWLTEDGKQPPVKVKARVGAHAMTRPGSGPIVIWRAVFQTLTCDSFRTMTDLVISSLPGGLVYRFRVWSKESQPPQVGVIAAERPERSERIGRDESEFTISKEIAHIYKL